MGYPPNQYGPPAQPGQYGQYIPPGQQPPGYPPQQGQQYGVPQPQYAPPQQAYGQQPGYGQPADFQFGDVYATADYSGGGGPPMPAGVQPAIIETAEPGFSKDGQKHQIVIKTRIEGGQYNGRHLTAWVTWPAASDPKGAKAAGMANKKAAGAAGLPVPDNDQARAYWAQQGLNGPASQVIPRLASMMAGRQVDIEVTLEPRRDDPSQNTNGIGMILPRGSQAQQAAAPQQGYAQPPAQPVQAQPAAPQHSYGSPPQTTGQPVPPGYQPPGGAPPAPPQPQQGPPPPWQQAQASPGGMAEFTPPGQAQQPGIAQQAQEAQSPAVTPNGQAPAQAPAQPQGVPQPPWNQQ